MKNWLKFTLFSIVVLAGSVGFASVVLSLTTPHPEEAPVVPAPVVVQDRPLLDLINELRAEKGVALLTASPELNASAQEKADDMATRHYFDHANPEGIKGWTLISKYLTSATRRSENLTMCPDSNLRAFKNWMNSPAHYRGMIDTTVTLYGTATAYDSEKHCTVYVNHFAAV